MWFQPRYHFIQSHCTCTVMRGLFSMLKFIFVSGWMRIPSSFWKRRCSDAGLILSSLHDTRKANVCQVEAVEYSNRGCQSKSWTGGRIFIWDCVRNLRVNLWEKPYSGLAPSRSINEACNEEFTDLKWLKRHQDWFVMVCVYGLISVLLVRSCKDGTIYLRFTLICLFSRLQ